MENVKKIDIGIDVIDNLKVIHKVNQVLSERKLKQDIREDSLGNIGRGLRQDETTSLEFVAAGLSRSGHVFVIQKMEILDRENPTICYDAFYLYKTTNGKVRKMLLVNSDFNIANKQNPYLVAIESTDVAIRQNVASQVLNFAEHDLNKYYGAEKITGDFCPFGPNENPRAAYNFYMKNGYAINAKTFVLTKKISMDKILAYNNIIAKEEGITLLPSLAANMAAAKVK